MFSRYENWLAWRYLRSSHRRGFVSFVAGVSVVGLMLGVAVLILVLSVLNGFERELRERILTVTSHATLQGLEGSLPDWQQQLAFVAQQEGVAAAAPYVESQAMLAAGTRLLAVNLRGIDPLAEQRLGGLLERLQQPTRADLQPGAFNVYVGAALARELQLKLGDDVIAMAPEATATPGGLMPRMRRLRVAGIFETGMYEYDRGLALLELSDAARLFRLGPAVTGIRVALTEPRRAPSLSRRLALDLGGGFYISDWTRTHANFFRSIELTKSMLFVILLMIVAVAAFNLVASLVMVVKEKQGDIALLRTLGAGPTNIARAFATLGACVGAVGTLGGALLGILGAHNIESIVRLLSALNGAPLLDAKVYFMSDLPAQVQWADVVSVCGVALLLCAVATLYPSLRAARTAPAEVLRHD